jgi:hypothetical protein
LEDTFDDLKAEFDAMMADKDGDEDEGDAEPEMDMDAGDDEGDDDEAEEAIAPEADLEVAPAFEGKKDANTEMREYVEKVTANMGDNGDNTKSPVAGANDMGGTAGNIAQGGDEKGGKADSAKEDNAGNVNVPGGKASKSMSANSKGHGAEKKGAGESGTDSKSTIGS